MKQSWARRPKNTNILSVRSGTQCKDMKRYYYSIWCSMKGNIAEVRTGQTPVKKNKRNFSTHFSHNKNINLIILFQFRRTGRVTRIKVARIKAESTTTAAKLQTKVSNQTTYLFSSPTECENKWDLPCTLSYIWCYSIFCIIGAKIMKKATMYYGKRIWKTKRRRRRSPFVPGSLFTYVSPLRILIFYLVLRAANVERRRKTYFWGRIPSDPIMHRRVTTPACQKFTN